MNDSRCCKADVLIHPVVVVKCAYDGFEVCEDGISEECGYLRVQVGHTVRLLSKPFAGHCGNRSSFYVYGSIIGHDYDEGWLPTTCFEPDLDYLVQSTLADSSRTCVVIASYNGVEVCEDVDAEERGYLCVEVGDAINVLSYPVAGHSRNTSSLYVYGKTVGNIFHQGWLPTRCLQIDADAYKRDAPLGDRGRDHVEKPFDATPLRKGTSKQHWSCDAVVAKIVKPHEVDLLAKVADVAAARCGQAQRYCLCCLFQEGGNLFDVENDWALCHCVSKDLEMSAGIAVDFKRIYGGQKELRDQCVEVGGVGVLRRQGRFIYYLVTKQRYYSKPTMVTLAQSLRAMRDHMLKNGVNQLAMPRIGCGRDKLSWDAVSELLLQVFYLDKVKLLIRCI